LARGDGLRLGLRHDERGLEALMSAATSTRRRLRRVERSVGVDGDSGEVERSVGVDVIGDGDSDEVERSVGVGDSDDDVER
jgi:hypothetical protein